MLFGLLAAGLLLRRRAEETMKRGKFLLLCIITGGTGQPSQARIQAHLRYLRNIALFLSPCHTHQRLSGGPRKQNQTTHISYAENFDPPRRDELHTRKTKNNRNIRSQSAKHNAPKKDAGLLAAGIAVVTAGGTRRRFAPGLPAVFD